MDERNALGLLRGLLSCERLPHAFLLLGEGATVAGFARKAAALLLDSDPESSPDFSWEEIPPSGQQENHGAEELRLRVQGFLQLRPEGKRRVLAIVGVERLSPEARDALLKPLEEPSADTVLFLGAPDANAVSQTLRSRCRILRLAGVDGPDGAVGQAWREIAARAASELGSARFDPRPHLEAVFGPKGSKKMDLAARRERAREFLRSWIAWQRASWREPGCAAPERAESMAEAALQALGDLRKQIAPELAVGGMLFSLAARGNFARE